MQTITRDEQLAADVAALLAFWDQAGHTVSMEDIDEQSAWADEERMDVIGQNGNTGEHYDETKYDASIDHFEAVAPVGTTPDYDPTGRDQHTAGAKVDGGKMEPGLILEGFARAIAGVTEVGTYGAAKYTRNGWQTVPEGTRRYTDAMYRHLLAHHRGEALDPESGLSHLKHAAWNALAILELAERS